MNELEIIKKVDDRRLFIDLMDYNECFLEKLQFLVDATIEGACEAGGTFTALILDQLENMKG